MLVMCAVWPHYAIYSYDVSLCPYRAHDAHDACFVAVLFCLLGGHEADFACLVATCTS